MVATEVLRPEGTAARVPTGAGTLTDAAGLMVDAEVAAAVTTVAVGAAPPVSHALKSAAEPSSRSVERVRAGLQEEKIKA